MERTLALKLRRRTMNLDENVLKHIVSIRFPDPAANEVRVNGCSVSGDEFGKGGRIAVTVAYEELAFVRRVDIAPWRRVRFLYHLFPMGFNEPLHTY
jgi:hypothetical protein